MLWNAQNWQQLDSLCYEYGETKPDSAIIYGKKAIQGCVKEKGKNSVEYAVCLDHIAWAYKTKSNFKVADSLYQKAKTTMQDIKQTKSVEYIEIINNLAFLYYAQGRYNDAETLYKEAKAIREKVLGKEHPYYAQSCNNLAVLYETQGRYSEAEPLYKEVISIKQKEIERNFKGLSETEKENYVKANIDIFFNDFQKFVSKRYTQNPTITTYSYNLVLATKGPILQSTEKIKNRILNSNDETLKKLYLEWKQTKDKYAKFQNLTIQQRTQKKINLDSIEKRANELEKELASKSEDFANVFAPKPITWQDIQNILKKDQAAIEIVRIEQNKDSVVYMALIVKKTSKYPEIVILPNSNELEKKHLTYYRRSIISKTKDEESYNAFWKPIKNALKDIKTAYFSPEGAYHQINSLTLQNPETKKYVSDEIQIINVTNTKDILQKRKIYAKNTYLIGNPTFNLGIDTKGNEKPAQSRNIEDLSQLPGAENEVKQVANYLPNSTLITGQEAIEEYVKYLKNPRILHVATHGYFKKDNIKVVRKLC